MSKRTEKALSPAEVQAALEEREAQAAFRSVLLTRDGRLAVRWLLRNACGVFDETYVPGLDGARHTDFNLGRRSVGLEVIRVAGIRLDGLREFEEHERQNQGSVGRNRIKERSEQRRRGERGEGQE